jgi:serine protease Do
MKKNATPEEEGLKTNDTVLAAGSFTDMVKHVEQSVFLIESYDRYGNTMQGTGFFIAENGMGVTNYHVVEGGAKWTIKTIDGSTYEVKDFLERNKKFDYAVFTIENQGDYFSPLSRSSTTPAKGEEIFVIGNPQGIESTVTKGIVSGLKGGTEDDIMNGKFNDGTNFLQIDVAISHGSSGSPVMNMKGELVGIATLSFQESNCINCNFAINIQLLKPYVEQAR